MVGSLKGVGSDLWDAAGTTSISSSTNRCTTNDSRDEKITTITTNRGGIMIGKVATSNRGSNLPSLRDGGVVGKTQR